MQDDAYGATVAELDGFGYRRAVNDGEAAVAYLRSPLAIRARCENILEGGTWAAGRAVAARLREGGRPADPDRVGRHGVLMDPGRD